MTMELDMGFSIWIGRPAGTGHALSRRLWHCSKFDQRSIDLDQNEGGRPAFPVAESPLRGSGELADAALCGCKLRVVRRP
jgi:hypothetical protein